MSRPTKTTAFVILAFGMAVLVGIRWSRPGGTGFPAFVDVAATSGITLLNISGQLTKDYILESAGNGAAFFDYDNDEDIDLLITNGSTLAALRTGGHPMAALYENDSGRFIDVTEQAGISATGWGMGVCAADYDNDGYTDLYVTAYGPNVLYRNTGNGRFEDRTEAAGVGDSQWSTNCAFGDYDRDGDVDLYVANYIHFDEATIPRRGETGGCAEMGMQVFCGPLDLPGEPDTLYRNDGGGTFSDVTVAAGIEDPGYYGFGAVFSDLDNDGWPDIFVANDSLPNFLFHNNGDGTFSDVSLISGAALSGIGTAQSGMGVGVGDYNLDGYLDLLVTHFAEDTNTLYRNMGDMFFEDVTNPAGLGEVSPAYLGWGTDFADLDNDGWKDIFVVNGHVYPQIDDLGVGQTYRQPKEVYRNLGDGRFREVAIEVGGDLLEPQPARGAAFGDFDSDGDLDVVSLNIDRRPNLYRNDGGNTGHWISLRLEGTESNRNGIGARVEIDVGALTQVDEVQSGGSYLSHSDMRIHFGLGEARVIDELRIHWPSGQTDVLNSVEAGHFLTIQEGAGVVESF